MVSKSGANCIFMAIARSAVNRGCLWHGSYVGKVILAEAMLAADISAAGRSHLQEPMLHAANQQAFEGMVEGFDEVLKSI